VIERDLLFLEHVRDAIERIERFTSEGRTAFMTDDKTQSAVIRQIEIIGEATKRLSEEFRRVHEKDLPQVKRYVGALLAAD
jgi:uncharacterized protein with HEPN domain